MSPTQLSLAFVCVCLALFSAYLLGKIKPHSDIELHNRYTTLDGLRGFLAFFVFLHHACIWYFYLQGAGWAAPPSSLYAYLGTGSVMMFFTVTALLFYSKLLDGKSKPIDWCRLFTSRLLRIVPLYIFAVLLVFCIVTYLTHAELQVSFFEIVRSGLKWLRFWSPSMPNLNGVSDSSLIVAAVFWTLPFEWGFYFMLPLFAIVLGVKTKPPIKYLLLTLMGVHLLTKDLHQLPAFFFGIAVAYMVRNTAFRIFSSGKIASALIIVSLSTAVIYFPDPREYGAQFLLFLSFALIACGNNLFGLFTNKLSKFLGDISYSIYLLHGILLFVTFNFVLGLERAKTLTAQEYGWIVVSLSPILVAIAFVTYQLIEKPGMQMTDKCTAWLARLGIK